MAIVIINNMPIGTGLGNYAQRLENSLPEAILFNFPYNPSYGYSFSDMALKPVSKNIVINEINYFIKVRSIISKKIKHMGKDIDVIHFSNHTILPFPVKQKSIVTIHDLYTLENWSLSLNVKLYFKPVLKAYMKKDNIIVLTEYLKNRLINKYNCRGNIFVVPHYVDGFNRISNKNSLREKYKLPKDKKLVLSVSADAPQKNLKILPKVMEYLGNNYTLVRVGPAIGNSITFEHLNQETLNEIYNACDILVYPSLYEGFGSPLIEAFSVGLPVAASDIEVFREIAGDSVKYFDPNNPKEAAESIMHIFDNYSYYPVKSFNRSKLYTKDVFANAMRNVYNKIKS